MGRRPPPADPNPNLQNRLPREDNAPIVPFDDKPPLMEVAKTVLGERMQETRWGFKLDGKLCNVRDILKAAGLKYADE
jgi:hypothetical protein